MILRKIDEFYFRQNEPAKSCLLALRQLILNHDSNLSEAWKYSMPFFVYNGKMFCYLWLKRKDNMPYIGIVEGKWIDHPDLIQEKRARMKILLIDPQKNIPVKKIKQILNAALKRYS